MVDVRMRADRKKILCTCTNKTHKLGNKVWNVMKR